MQKHGEVLADLRETRGQHLLGVGADDHVVAVLAFASEQLVAHGSAYQVGSHLISLSCPNTSV
ncbi:hypothetical protein D3C74_492590 [compost metagenome]